MTEEITESARAIQEVAKTAGKGIDASRELGSFLSRVFGDAPADLVVAAQRLRPTRI